jgi:hypothetical protein
VYRPMPRLRRARGTLGGQLRHPGTEVREAAASVRDFVSAALNQDSSQVKKPSSQARMTASTTTINTASVMALGFAERSGFSVSVVSDFIVMSLRSRSRGEDVWGYAGALPFIKRSNGASACAFSRAIPGGMPAVAGTTPRPACHHRPASLLGGAGH